jgi:hypothetical protein
MSTDSIHSDAVVSFSEFVIDTPEEGIRRWSRPPFCLADYIRTWVISGEGVRISNCDFRTYLIGVIGIIDAWADRESRFSLNYLANIEGEDDHEVVERSVTSVLGDRKNVYDILDPHFFATWTFRYMYPERAQMQ